MTTAPSQSSFLATRRGKLTLFLLCAVGFLDFVDTSIVNVALPSIRHDLHFSVQNLQWVLSGYLLTYGGFLLLGGRAADLLGRRRILVTGTALFSLSSMACGLAQNSGTLIGARLVQGLGAAMMTPAALSILTTSFNEGTDRLKALGAWGALAGLSSGVGVFLGGVLSGGPGWRWVFFVNPPISVLVLLATFQLIGDDRRRAKLAHFDTGGAILATSAMLLAIYALVRAPEVGWNTTRTIAGLGGVVVLLFLFLVNERRHANPLVPLSIFRIKGLAAADVTQIIAMAGFYSMFFFVTLYMQNVLHFSPTRAGAVLHSCHRWSRHLRGRLLQALCPHRHSTDHGRRSLACCKWRLLALADTGSRFLPHRSAPGSHGHVNRTRRRVRGRSDGRQRRRAPGQGRSRRRPDQRIFSTRCRPRARHLLCDRDLSYESSTGWPHRPAWGPHFRFSSSALRLQPFPGRRRCNCAARYQHTWRTDFECRARTRLRDKPGARSRSCLSPTY